MDERVGGHFGFLGNGESEEAVFHGADAVEPPVAVGDGLARIWIRADLEASAVWNWPQCL